MPLVLQCGRKFNAHTLCTFKHIYVWNCHTFRYQLSMGRCDKQWRQTQEGETASALQLLSVWLTAEVLRLTQTSDSAETITVHLTLGLWESLVLNTCLRLDLCSLALRCKLEMSACEMVAFEFLLNNFWLSVATLSAFFFFLPFIKGILLPTHEWRLIWFDLKKIKAYGSSRCHTFILLSVYIFVTTHHCSWHINKSLGPSLWN